MESNLNKVAKEALSKVSGFAVVDSQGLLLSAEGAAKETNASLVSTIAELASKLDPGSSKPPVVSIESSKSKILIQSKDSITTALFQSTK